MYNRYLKQQSSRPRPAGEETPRSTAPSPEEERRSGGRMHAGPARRSPGFPGIAAKAPGGIGEGLRQLKSLLGEGAELGDLLLVLILLLLYLEKEDEEILIILSALVVMGFR